MSRPRPALAVLASITLLLAVLSTTVAVSKEAAGPVQLVVTAGPLAAEPIAHLLVSEVMTGGTSASDELIELYNPSAAALPLEGLEVIYVTATGGTTTRKASWAAGAGSLPSGAHLLIANAAGAFAGIADADLHQRPGRARWQRGDSDPGRQHGHRRCRLGHRRQPLDGRHGCRSARTGPFDRAASRRKRRLGPGHEREQRRLRRTDSSGSTEHGRSADRRVDAATDRQPLGRGDAGPDACPDAERHRRSRPPRQQCRSAPRPPRRR